MQPHIGISEENLAAVSHTLNAILADEFMLYAKTRAAHWNIEGADFYNKHLFFEKQYEELDEIMDSVAERIRFLGHYAPATLHEYLRLTHFSERFPDGNTSEAFIRHLLEDHEALIIKLRENINRFANDLKDTGTSDFITGLMETHEKMAWMLRAHLK